LEASEIDLFTLKRLGFSVQSDVDDAVFARIEELLDHPSLEVRDAAVMAAGTTGWTEWLEVLRPLFEKLPPGKLKARTADAIRICEGYYGNN
jgi:HEAT repeat protein